MYVCYQNPASNSQPKVLTPPLAMDNPEETKRLLQEWTQMWDDHGFNWGEKMILEDCFFKRHRLEKRQRQLQSTGPYFAIAILTPEEEKEAGEGIRYDFLVDYLQQKQFEVFHLEIRENNILGENFKEYILLYDIRAPNVIKK